MQAGDQKGTVHDDSSTPSRVHERSSSDLMAGLGEQLQEFDSLSLPPGLYAPEMPSSLGIQATNQAQSTSLDHLQTQVGTVRLSASDKLNSVHRISPQSVFLLSIP